MSKEGYQLTGQNVQGYKISKPIGQGKFSIVYKAQNQKGIPFALKKIKIFDMADQKQRQKCLKQVELMKPLNHPNIIQYIDSFIHNNQLIIVAEWADKGDLKKLIKQHESDQIFFEESIIWQYMKQISSALKHMHQKRIMHRDLKPANIFISHDLTLKVGDLGLGRSFSSQTLQAYSKVGTPLYMSPQLIQDSGYNQNADVWSLGCIIYELCELNSPFRNKQQKMSLMDLFQNITKCNYKPISSRYSPELSQAIRNMIVVDPSKRWSSNQVYQLSSKMLDGIKKPKLDPIITMDDIHIKLNLLNYAANFCKGAQRKAINKFYFAIQDDKCKQHDQLFYFLQLSYWVMSLQKANSQKMQKLAVYSKSLIDWKSPDNACKKFLNDLNVYGVKLQDISIQSIRDGYGQAVCYLLNEVLNRELIRCNFQFLQPEQAVNEQQEDKINSKTPQKSSAMDQNQQLSDPQKVSEDQFQQESQFEQSIFFNKNQRKQKNIGGQFLQKIQQFDEDQARAPIYSRIDQKQWMFQCERLSKKFTEMTQNTKELRKKMGYQNFETVKISSAKLTDLIHYVRPASTVLMRKIDQQLQIIRDGQKQINMQYKDVKQSVRQANASYQSLAMHQELLATSIKQKHQILEKVQQKIEEYQQKIKTAAEDNSNNKKGDIKKAIINLKTQIKEMDQKQGIMLWEVIKYKTKSKQSIIGNLNNLSDMKFDEL